MYSLKVQEIQNCQVDFFKKFAIFKVKLNDIYESNN